MTAPSLIIIALITGFCSKVFTGWKKLTEATIYGDGFTVEFYRHYDKTIDPNCDALNGWYSFPTGKYVCKLIVNGEEDTIYFKGDENADKLFHLFKDIKSTEDEEGRTTAKDNAEIAFIAIKNFIC